MLRSVYISRYLAGFLLIVFALSITPKRFLHDSFANHIDKKQEKKNAKPYQVAYAGYHCDNDELVVESGFVSDHYILSFPLFLSFSAYLLKDISFSSSSGIYSSLRGPPVNI